MDDLLVEFLTETSENLEVIDTELVRFEADPGDQATLNNIFRLVHTIKGTCGFLGLPRLEAIAHAGETLLGRFRDGALPVTPEVVTLVLRSIDRIKMILVDLQETGAEPNGDDQDIIKELQDAAEGKAAARAAPAPPPASVEHPVGPNGEKWDADLQRFLRPGEVSLADLEAAFLQTQPDALPAPVPSQAIPAPAGPPLAQAAAAPGRPERPTARDADTEDEDAAKGGREVTQSIRVNVDVLQQLMDTVSELVLTRNQLLQMVRGLNDSEFKAPLQRLSNITADLQDRVMKTRMQPVGTAWRKLPRIVRDICRETGKRIELKLEGEQTELDRQVLELIKDPLTHMIRNSADHGIEPPAARLAAGKSDIGTIRLTAHHEGGHIIILVQDDGQGLNLDRIRAKVVEKGLATEAELSGMSETQIQRFIFAPGFSTASAVTNLSGRGVGMDVVRTNIELIGGSIELQSRQGQGATFRIKIPLTLAIVSALIIGAGGQRFAAPQSSVLELVRVGPEAEHQIDHINATPVLRLRDKLLPLLELSGALKLPATPAAPGKTRYVVVMQVGAARFGVIVDEVHDTEEIVVKPLASILRGVPALSGATILGEGSVIVILDPNGLADALGAAHPSEDAAANADEDQGQASAREEAQESLVLFRAGGEELKAAPLMLVTRLEQAEARAIERADGRAVMQYRGALMPILHAGGDHLLRTEGMQPVLVFAHGERPFGLAVDEIVDIVHERITVDLACDRPGVIGAAIVRGKAVELMDLSHFLENAAAAWPERFRRESKGRVLIVEESEFTRNLLAPLIRAAGYEIESAKGLDDAWSLHEAGRRFDAILADVDRDPLAAEQFARTAAADALWGDAARIGLTAAEGRAGEFSECVRKTDRAQLLAAIDYAIRSRRATDIGSAA
jgi:two-component system chemotaxis sensor kinase CheA